MVGRVGAFKLYLSMYGTLTVLIALSTLFFAVILTWIGFANLFVLALLVIVFNLVQWLYAPKLIEALYHVREVSPKEYPKIYRFVESLSQKIGLKTPKIMVAEIPIPNAFAYGSPLTGNRIAVTKELLKILEDEEVEAVVGHELGHLKHKDVQIMMFASVLPAIFYFLGYSLLLSGWFGGYRGSRDGEGALPVLALGAICIGIYWLLSLFVLGLSRYREYYADRESALNIEEGPRKLSEALAKIVYFTGKIRRTYRRETSSLSYFKTLFISDPDKAEKDNLELIRFKGFSDQQLVKEILSKKVTWTDRIMEIFSTHPNIVKRLKALKELEKMKS